MDGVFVATAILTLLAGIGIFLVGCNILSSGLESLSSNRLKKLFSKATDSKLLGVGIGTVTTAAIQSSGATTVLIIGFVNAGIVSLPLAATMVYGANIGTTVTAQIVALGMFGDGTVSMTVIFSALAGIGAFIASFGKKDRTKKVGDILAGFGMLFVGLMLMSSSMESFAELESVKLFLAGIKNIVLLVLIGAALTAIVQSSSVMTTVAIAMLVAGLIDLEQGIYLTLGSNIGSCIVAIIAGFSSSLNAKRTAMIHLLFNVSGAVIFTAIGIVLAASIGFTYSSLFEGLFPGAPQTQLAMFHTFFNVVTVAIMLPLTGKLVSTVTRILPDKAEEPAQEDEKPHFHYINEYMLRTPPVAVQQMKNEVVRMAETAMENFRLSCRMICTMDFSDKALFKSREKELNYINKEGTRFLVKLSNTPLSDKDRIYVSTIFHSLTDLERVGDYAKNIVGYAEKLESTGCTFSPQAKKEVEDLVVLVDSLYAEMMRAYVEADRAVLKEGLKIEDMIDDVTDSMAESHVKRLNEGICTIDVGAEYLKLTSDAERVADHFVNVGKSIKEYAPK